MSLTLRPSRPPLALVSSSQILAPANACLPLGASGPVTDMAKPTVIGPSLSAQAGAATRPMANTAAARPPPVRTTRQDRALQQDMAFLPKTNLLFFAPPSKPLRA